MSLDALASHIALMSYNHLSIYVLSDILFIPSNNKGGSMGSCAFRARFCLSHSSNISSLPVYQISAGLLT